MAPLRKILDPFLSPQKHKRSQAYTRPPEDYASDALNDVPLPVCRFTPDGTILLANTAFCAFFGCRAEETWNTNVFDFLPLPVRNELFNLLPLLERGTPCMTKSITIPDRHGDNRFLQCTLRAHKDNEGRVTAYQCVGQDVTELTRRAEELKRLENSIDLVHDGVAVLDADGTCRYCNQAKARLHGIRDPKRLQSRPIQELYDQEFRKFMETEILDTLRSHGRWEGEVTAMTVTGQPLPLSVCLTMLDNGQIVSVSRDLLAQKKYQETIQDNLNFQQDLIEGIPMPVFFKDQYGRYLGCNTPFAEKIVGRSREQVLGRTVFDLFPSALAQELARKEMALMAMPGHKIDESTIPFSDGAMHTVQCHRFTTTDTKGEVVGIVGVMLDMTEKYALEQQIRHAQKIEIIGNLAGGIAHDFNNILSAIVGNAELAKIRLPSTSPLQEQVSSILTASERARRLIQKMLVISQRTQQERRPFSVPQLVAEVVDLLRASLADTIKLDIRQPENTSHLCVHGDPGQLHQVVMNLVTNAAQAIGNAPGTITLRLDSICVLDCGEASDDGATCVRLRVEDTGPGIPEDQLENIFEPYVTTKAESGGSGLGLAVVRGIVEGHEGQIAATNLPGAGAQFTLLLPCTCSLPEPLQTFVGSDTKSEPEEGSGHILLVDDDPALLQTGRECLLSLGYTVAAFNDPKKALHSFRQAPDNYDIVLTDQSMPGLSGTDLAAEVVQVKSDTPVLVMTGMGVPRQSESGSTGSVREVLLKPLRLGELAAALRRTLYGDKDEDKQLSALGFRFDEEG